ncbi:MAG: hypothetical protein RSN61_21280 [Chryseobacterium sp.]|uniref:hypothetical protein n=1 Tax=Chryseobacterium sp. TaxID=1871047 RepID=UPI002FC9916D
MSKHIVEGIQKGYSLLPTEGERTLMVKVPFKNFLAIDYRQSNHTLVSADTESVVAPFEAGLTHASNYVMGFAVVRNPAAIAEFAQSSRATTTRIRKKIIETLATVLSDVRVPQNRGHRSVFIESENKDGFTDIAPILKMVGVTGQVNSEYMVLPFFVSTSVFFNNYRAKIGVGNAVGGKALLKDDTMRRMPNAFAEVEAKINRRLPNPLTSSLFVGLVLASPEHIMNDSVYKTDVLDYANEDNAVTGAVANSQASQSIVSASTPSSSAGTSQSPYQRLQAMVANSMAKAVVTQPQVAQSASLPKPTNTKNTNDGFKVNPDTGEIEWD